MTASSVSWADFAADAPELAAAIRGRFTAHRHHVLATLRSDGAPRVSGTEVDFRGPDLTLGSMLNAVKAHDLQRDPRYAIHANPGDHSMTGGDAKIAGVARELEGEELAQVFETLPPELVPCHIFVLDLAEVVLTTVETDPDRLRIQLWRPGAGVRVIER